MIDCFIALGSNLGDSEAILRAALEDLSALPDSELTACSRWHQSAAIGPGAQPDYLNGVAAVKTRLAPLQLLARLQAIETAHGRIRSERWAARTLDLDLLLYGDQVINDEKLTVPHPRLTERAFVLFPLYELAPGLVLPCGTRIESLLERCPGEGLQAPGEAIDPGR